MTTEGRQFFQKASDLAVQKPLVFGIASTILYILALTISSNLIFKGVPEYTSAFFTSLLPLAVMAAFGFALTGRRQLAVDTNDGFAKGLLLSWPVLIPLAGTLFFRILPASEAGLAPNWVTLLIFGILGGFAVGAAEEFAFRKVILGSILSRRISAMKALVISSVLFGLFHLVNLTVTPHAILGVGSQVVYTGCLGLLLGAIYLRTKNIWVPILVHGTIDAVDNIAGIFVTAAQTGAPQDIGLFSALIVIVVTIPGAIAGLLYTKKVATV